MKTDAQRILAKIKSRDALLGLALILPQSDFINKTAFGETAAHRFHAFSDYTNAELAKFIAIAGSPERLNELAEIKLYEAESLQILRETMKWLLKPEKTKEKPKCKKRK